VTKNAVLSLDLRRATRGKWADSRAVWKHNNDGVEVGKEGTRRVQGSWEKRMAILEKDLPREMKGWAFTLSSSQHEGSSVSAS
jgi:hypothetical protein